MSTEMTTRSVVLADAPARTARRSKRPPHGHSHLLRRESRGAWLLLSPYMIVLVIVGLIPIGYAVVTSMMRAPTPVDPTSGFGGFSSFVTVFTDYRFIQTFLNIFAVLIIWIPIMMIGIVGMSLLVHASPGRFGSTMRFLYYIPAALAGIANLMLWVYLLNPSQSPIQGFWNLLGLTSIKAVVASPGHLPFILTAMLFFQGTGTWIVIVNGGLNGISDEVLEAARLDGAGAWKLAWHVKIPLIRPWVGYAALMNVAYGFQLFLEPQLLDQVSSNAVADQWAPNQLAYAFAFSNFNFPAAAALSLVLLVITLAIGMVIVFRSGLFGDEEH
ncbi:carbohydrate ABC transporter permease [Microbacterium terrisoli]|uniref:carbohydrate ABC transporter permease n=1 Tax=Microbacterium terrisoli TaxID=3242192 RepID=UPI002805F03C|nr:sugar ABC transporter permease [Microbacterium protaetiae]